jgi:hypothetical protein
MGRLFEGPALDETACLSHAEEIAQCKRPFQYRQTPAMEWPLALKVVARSVLLSSSHIAAEEFFRSHPGNKNKDVARVGHPNSIPMEELL